ncbi:MAG: flagellar biosynthetic protein FliR [Acidimicrobiales bacterium]
MVLDIDPTLLAGFLFALVRTGAWLAVAPPFNSNAVPIRVKLAISVSLAMLLAPTFDADPGVLETTTFVTMLAYQALVGVALGFVVQLFFAAVQAAGQMIDVAGAFASASLYDPFSNASSTPMGRLFQIVAITILFAIDGHLMLVRGLMASFEAAPLSGLQLDGYAEFLVGDVTTFFVAAAQIAFPMLAALFLAEVALGLLSRAAPQINILVIGFNVKILVLIFLGGLTLAVLPGAVARIVEQSVMAPDAWFGG